MFQAALFVTIVLAAVGMGLALAHALELPGKRRLGRDAYFAVQTIYYPGFTIGGAFGEALGMAAALVTLLFTTPGTPAFWLVLGVFVCLAIEHGVYWLITHPANQILLPGQNLPGAGAPVFSSGVALGKGGPPSVGLKTTLTACSHFNLSKSQSTMLVTMRGPSASVT